MECDVDVVNKLFRRFKNVEPTEKQLEKIRTWPAALKKKWFEKDLSITGQDLYEVVEKSSYAQKFDRRRVTNEKVEATANRLLEEFGPQLDEAFMNRRSGEMFNAVQQRIVTEGMAERLQLLQNPALREAFENGDEFSDELIQKTVREVVTLSAQLRGSAAELGRSLAYMRNTHGALKNMSGVEQLFIKYGC